MKKVTVDGKTINLPASAMIGEGGEAEVYDIGGGEVVKVFKLPNHISFQGSPEAQRAARHKLEEHQRKLPSFPKDLPDRIIGPRKLALSPADGSVIGYTMPYRSGGDSLQALSEKTFREGGFDDRKVVTAFADLHATVTSAHAKKFVFGDFNDLNGIVEPDGKKVWMLDADSAQFGGFLCMLFTIKFMDPRCAKLDAQGRMPVLARPHDELSDWYAFALMLMQSWLFVGPFGGVFRPKDPARRVPHDARSLGRVTVWDSEVIYPRPARPLGELPTDVQEYFESVFRNDKREPFPAHLLESLNRKAHGLVPEKTEPLRPGTTHSQVKGVKADQIFQTSGSIISVVQQKGELKWLYAENGSIYRENSRKVVSGMPQRGMRYRIAGSKTVIAMDQQVMILDEFGNNERWQTDIVSQRPMVDANADSVFVIPKGELSRLTKAAMGTSRDVLGRLMSDQTMFWTGDELGFGFYRAGGFCMYFIFGTKGSGVNDNVQIPPIAGNLIDATVTFGKDRVWFFIATQENGQRLNRCYLLDGKGTVISTAKAVEGDGSWLSSIRGKSAAGPHLFVATDDGIVRVESNGSFLEVTKEFSDTARFAHSGTPIIVHKGGIAVVRSGEIWNLTVV